MADPGALKSGITARGCCMAATDASLSSRLPSGGEPAVEVEPGEREQVVRPWR